MLLLPRGTKTETYFDPFVDTRGVVAMEARQYTEALSLLILRHTDVAVLTCGVCLTLVDHGGQQVNLLASQTFLDFSHLLCQLQ